MNAQLRAAAHRIGEVKASSVMIFLVALLALTLLFGIHNGELTLAEMVWWQISTTFLVTWEWIKDAAAFVITPLVSAVSAII